MTRLEQLRLDKRMTPEQLGEAAGVSGMTVRRCEASKPTRVTSLAKLAEYLDATASELQQPARFQRDAA